MKNLILISSLLLSSTAALAESMCTIKKENDLYAVYVEGEQFTDFYRSLGTASEKIRELDAHGICRIKIANCFVMPRQNGDVFTYGILMNGQYITDWDYFPHTLSIINDLEHHEKPICKIEEPTEPCVVKAKKDGEYMKYAVFAHGVQYGPWDYLPGTMDFKNWLVNYDICAFRQ